MENNARRGRFDTDEHCNSIGLWDKCGQLAEAAGDYKNIPLVFIYLFVYLIIYLHIFIRYRVKRNSVKKNVFQRGPCRRTAWPANARFGYGTYTLTLREINMQYRQENYGDRKWGQIVQIERPEALNVKTRFSVVARTGTIRWTVGFWKQTEDLRAISNINVSTQWKWVTVVVRLNLFKLCVGWQGWM